MTDADDTPTRVIFRKYREGDVVAVFPDLPGTSDPSTVTTYQHIGQHSSAGAALVMAHTTPAREGEPDRDALAAELYRIGYRNLDIRERMPRDCHARRLAALRRD